jgi:hypothetical protein
MYIASRLLLQDVCSSFPNGNDQHQLSTSTCHCISELLHGKALHMQTFIRFRFLPVTSVMAFKLLASSQLWSRVLYLLAIMQAVLGLDSFANDTLSLPGAASYVAAVGFPTSAFA